MNKIISMIKDEQRAWRYLLDSYILTNCRVIFSVSLNNILGFEYLPQAGISNVKNKLQNTIHQHRSLFLKQCTLYLLQKIYSRFGRFKARSVRYQFDSSAKQYFQTKQIKILEGQIMPLKSHCTLIC